MLPRLCLAALVLGLPGCDLVSGWLDPVPFVLTVTPTQINDSIPGQRCVLLVTVENDAAEDCLAGPVRLTASAADATVMVQPTHLWPGQVAEVTVIPDQPKGDSAQLLPENDEGWDITATIRADRDGIAQTREVPVHLWSDEPDLVGETAAEMRDLFIPWLAENRPELGITADTRWTGTIVTLHILVVTHYLYFSEDWEMHVYWHVMIPPYDWSKIELRRRFEETAPSLAFEIPSRSADPLVVEEIEPEGTLWR